LHFESNDWAKCKVLRIVAGDSGSGKTTTAIASALKHGTCLYWTPGERVEWELRKIMDRQNEPIETRKTQRQGKLMATIKNLVTSIATVECKTERPVYLVVDELGSCPTILRALCGLYEQQALSELADQVLAKSFQIIACGTGCDGLSTAPGSSIASYELFRMQDDSTGKEFMDILATQASFPASLRAYLGKLDETSSVVRLLRNRRVAAAFHEGLRLIPDDAARDCQWDKMVEPLATQALLRYRSLNGMKYMSTATANFAFSQALALSMAGPHCKLRAEDRKLLSSYGLLCDNALRVKRDDAESTKFVRLEDDKTPDQSDVDGVLVLPVGKHRYSMSAAVREMGLRSFGVSPRNRTWGGFEDTVRDFLMLTAIAGSSGLAAGATMANDPLGEIRNKVLGACSRVAQVLCFTFVRTKPVRNAQDVLDEIRNDLGEARILDKPRKIALIYKNVDKAPAQDVGLVVVEQDSASTALRVTHEFRLQVKYFTAGSGMQDWEIASEFFKMGSRKVAHVAGGIVAALKKPKSSTSLYITAEEICKAASECGVGQAPKLRDQNVSWSGQWRSSLFSALCGAEELCESQKHSDDASSSLTLSLIAFFESAQQKQSKHQDKMDEGIFAVSMAEHMFPAAMNAVSCAKVDDVVRVSIQCTAVEGMPDAATT
jgi:hypothetical protein